MLQQVSAIIHQYALPVAGVLFAIFVALAIRSLFRRRIKASHAWRIKSSKRLIEKLKTMPNDAVRMAYIRKIDPYVLEEAILSAVEMAEMKATRGARYSGDQGCDGVFTHNGQRYFIQAKRYRSHISLQHLKEFHDLCTKNGVHGYFAHSGRTGKGSKGFAGASNRVTIISGSKLFDLLSGEKGRVMGVLGLKAE